MFLVILGYYEVLNTIVKLRVLRYSNQMLTIGKYYHVKNGLCPSFHDSFAKIS